MSKRSGLRESALKLVAGAPADVPFTGNYIRLSSALYPVLIEIDGNDTFKLSPGEDIVFQDGASFERLRLTTIAPIDDLITLAIGSNVKVGSAKVSGSVVVSNNPVIGGGFLEEIQNDVKVIDRGFEYGGSYKSMTPLVVNVPDVVLMPGENINGVIIHVSNFYTYNASSLPLVTLIAKSSVPTSNLDGDVLMSMTETPSGGLGVGSLHRPVRVAPGKGIYFISNVSESAAMRNLLFTRL